ncbi:MAG: polyprenyl synthetase family protein [Actinomycetota bacterium]
MSDAPDQLLRVAAQVEKRLITLFEREGAHWRAVDLRLGEAVDQLGAVLTGGGKRLRAAFCYWGWRGVHPDAADETAIIDAGAAFELLQAFALIHDDIMDDSGTRRGRPTIHVDQAQRLRDQGWHGEPRRFGEGVAILVGDLGHAYADQLMAGIHADARTVWDELRIELNLGQYLDLRSAAAGELDQATAHQVSMYKSALYTIVRPLQLGANLEGRANGAVIEGLDDYGRPLGRAFQLKDDLLGVLGDAETLGKPVGEDLREGKPTELLAVALERAGTAQRALLDGVGRRSLTAEQVAAIVEVLHDTGAVSEIEARIAKLVGVSTAHAADLPFDNVAKEALTALAEYVASRTS